MSLCDGPLILKRCTMFTAFTLEQIRASSLSDPLKDRCVDIGTRIIRQCTDLEKSFEIWPSMADAAFTQTNLRSIDQMVSTYGEYSRFEINHYLKSDLIFEPLLQSLLQIVVFLLNIRSLVPHWNYTEILKKASISHHASM